MAPSPEYDKEPKAPDKSASNISSEDTKLLNNLIKDPHLNSDHKTTNTATNSEVENNKHVEALDDDKLRALLNEALTYKCPKDLEGKSNLFKELLEEVKQDDQEACEAAARNLTGCRGGRRSRGRHALAHSNSLQDLVAALAAEPAPRRHARHHPPAPHPASVSARAIHGGSLPSGVDTSSLLSEEAGSSTGAGYLATVRCVNPPPLAERRVSASDANAPHELELLNRRSKPMFPMTYTARATLEIGSGSVCSGRAVTTTTASNQVRTSPHPPAAPASPPSPPRPPPRAPPAPALPCVSRLAPQQSGQRRLMSAICPKINDGGGSVTAQPGAERPRGPEAGARAPRRTPARDGLFEHSVGLWYGGLANYAPARVAYKDGPPTHCAPARLHREPREDARAAPGLPTLDPVPLRGNTFENINESLYYNNDHCGQSRRDKIAHGALKQSKVSDSTESDISVRKTYRERIVTSPAPTSTSINPRNVRNMSIGEPKHSLGRLDLDSAAVVKEAAPDGVYGEVLKVEAAEVTPGPEIKSGAEEISLPDVKSNDLRIDIENEISESTEDQTWKCFQMSDISARPAEAANPSADNYAVELEEIVCHRASARARDTAFSDYLADQEKLLRVLLQVTDLDSKPLEDEYTVDVLENNNNIEPTKPSALEPGRNKRDVSNESDINMSTNTENDAITSEKSHEHAAASGEVVPASRADDRAAGDRYILAELPNNAYIFLTLPKRLLTPLNREYRPAEVTDVTPGRGPPDKPRRKKDKPVASSTSTKRKDTINKNALRVLLFENLLKSDRASSAVADKEVDSAIPFSCITTPEVVASCNTTASTSQAAVAVDPKPLQLPSEYRAVASLVGAPLDASAPAPPTDALDEQPRSVIATSFNGLPLSRPNYGATAAGDEYKKSLDENGNSVQGYSSPLSGSSQHKKPRRKKSSKNETVIDCRQLDGYRGDKDVNELLRFIESAASHRAPKPRAKHRDDDDKGKKRSSERRKDKEHKPARASSLEELSRTTLEELTAPPAPAAPAAPPEPPPAETADFQTVTKKRKPRRRTEEAPRRARVPDPRRQDSAPPSDRSNDSNDDLESVHSLPERAPPAAAPPHASYADIARTRHNIPDLIESCNYYAEGEEAPAPAAATAPAALAEPGPTPDARAGPPAAARRPPRDKPAPPARRDRKERAPDVVADRRPPVVLLDSSARPRDMDGVTFGFDINEQLLGGGARRPRCDLVRDALEAAPVPVRAAKRALRYVPPPQLPDYPHLHQIIDYIGNAWEEIMRCGAGGGKVRYFSE